MLIRWIKLNIKIQDDISVYSKSLTSAKYVGAVISYNC